MGWQDDPVVETRPQGQQRWMSDPVIEPKRPGQRVSEFLFGDDDPTTQNFGEKIGTALNMAGEAMTFGLIGDEASAAVAGAIPGGLDYAERRDFERQQQGLLEATNPGVAIGAQIGGALLAPAGMAAAAPRAASAVLAALRGNSALGTVARSAGAGAAAGLSQGYAEGEGGIRNRAASGGAGLGIGTVAGAAAVPLGQAIQWATRYGGKTFGRLFTDRRFFSNGTLTDEGRQTLNALGYNADEVTEAFQREFGKNIDAALAPQEAAAAAELGQFGIPAYRHNVTGSADDFAAFERGRRGALGAGTEARVRQAADAQEMAARQAGDDIATGLGGGVRGDQFDAASAVSERLRGLAGDERAAAQAAYKAADAAGVTVPAHVAKGVADRVGSRLADEEIDLTLDTFKHTRAFMGRIAKRGEGTQPVSLRLIDGLRKDLNATLSRADGEDRRALTILKGEYDTWLDEVVSAKLFNGDEKGVTALKEARGLWATYAQKFAGKDRTSKFIQSMIDSDASPDDVTRWLFSAGKLGSGQFNSTLAAGLKKTLGEASPEWLAVKQAAFRQLVQKPEGTVQWGPQKISQNIGDFLTSPGSRALSRELFSPSEIRLMMQYQAGLRRMVPPAGAVNHSGTAYEMARMGREAFKALTGAVGMASGGPGAGVAASAATGAVQRGSNWLAGRSLLRPGAKAALDAGAAPLAAGVQAGNVGAYVTSRPDQGPPR